MRYQEGKSVEKVLDWLKQQSCPISRRSYHEFMRRVLRLMPMDQASDLGVNVDLLRAIRVRYKIPSDPKRVGAFMERSTPRHDSRAHRRRIVPSRKSQSVSTPLEHTLRTKISPVATPTSLPSTGIASTPKQGEVPKMRGTPDDPQGYGDWKIINMIACKKVWAIDRSMMLNNLGTVIHTRSRHEYTQEELEKQFGLTPNEAESCFMTFTAAESPPRH